MLCNDLAGTQLSALSSVLILLETSVGLGVLDYELLFISVAINIGRCNRVVMMGLFPRALEMSKTLFVTCYFKSHIYKEKIDSCSRPTMSFLPTADISEIKYPFSFLLLVPCKGRNPADSWAGVAIVSKVY